MIHPSFTALPAYLYLLSTLPLSLPSQISHLRATGDAECSGWSQYIYNIKSNDPNNPYPGLTNFSLLSHGFGNPAINTSLSVVQTYLQELLAFYDGRKPIQPENRYAMFGGDKVHGPLPNGMAHPTYANAMPGRNADPQSVHHSQSAVSMKQEPIGSPRNCPL